MSYGAYCTNSCTTCFPAGATLSSSAEGIVISTTGRAAGAPRAACSYASWISWTVVSKWTVPRCSGPGGCGAAAGAGEAAAGFRFPLPPEDAAVEVEAAAAEAEEVPRMQRNCGRRSTAQLIFTALRVANGSSDA